MPLPLLVNPARTIAPVDPKVFGTFVENLCDGLYGGVYDPGSPVSDEDGFRTDVIDACRRMGVSLARFPGGCFAPKYDWKDGIGPVELRPRVRYGDVVNHGMEENEGSNRFGTDEFLRWCRKVGAEPYLTVNMGNRGAQDAADWVEYCNGPVGSRWGAERARNGHPEPYGVAYWSLGNEISGEWELGHCATSREYIERVKDYVDGMKRVDPGIRLVFNGSVFPLEGTVEERDWNRAVLEAYLEEADFLSAHFYIGSCGSSRNVYRIDPADLRAIHHRVQDAAALVQDVADVLRADFLLANRRRDMARSIGIAFDEYNPWRRNRPGDTLDRFFDHTDALAVAEMFGIFVRNADVFRICCMAQLVNVLPAMSCRSGTADFVRHGTSLVQEMFLENRGRMAVDAYVDSPRYRGYLDRPVPYVTCSATAGEDRIVLNLVNRHMDEAFDVDVQVAGRTVTGITGRRLVAEAPDAVNTFDRPDAIRIEPFDAEPGRPLRIEPLRAVVCEVSLAP